MSDHKICRKQACRNLSSLFVSGVVGGCFSYSWRPLPSLATMTNEGEQRMILTKKPKAPLAALIPAAQQRVLLEQCVYLSNQLARINDDKTNDPEKTLQQLKAILAPLPSSSNTRHQMTNLQVLQASPPNQRLSGSVTAAAMNVFMQSLRYDDEKLPEYTVTDNAWKKSYIREYDGLPSIQSVLQADLNLRELYRNDLVTTLDDASAELYSYSASGYVDAQELQQLFQSAANSFDLWLERIDESQVTQALQAALEGKTTKIYDSYYAGFVPPTIR